MHHLIGDDSPGIGEDSNKQEIVFLVSSLYVP
jgi:hypothetical protein